MGCDNFFLCEENSTYLLARLGWFCPVVSEPVKPYFTRFLRVLTFCLRASKIVILKENGVVNGVVKRGESIISFVKQKFIKELFNQNIYQKFLFLK